jgi:predicted amidohydrolase
MPTKPERMVWGFGDGSGLNAVDTAVCRVGALICCENYMPLAELFPNKDEWINAGDAVVYKPFGGIAAGPMHRKKGLLIAEIEFAAARASRRKFDASGHYARRTSFPSA